MGVLVIVNGNYKANWVGHNEFSLLLIVHILSSNEDKKDLPRATEAVDGKIIWKVRI